MPGHMACISQFLAPAPMSMMPHTNVICLTLSISKPSQEVNFPQFRRLPNVNGNAKRQKQMPTQMAIWCITPNFLPFSYWSPAPNQSRNASNVRYTQTSIYSMMAISSGSHSTSFQHKGTFQEVFQDKLKPLTFLDFCKKFEKLYKLYADTLWLPKSMNNGKLSLPSVSNINFPLGSTITH